MSEFSSQEAHRYLGGVSAHVSFFTDVLLIVPKKGGACKLASCLHIDWNGRPLLLTCKHVLRPKHEYFTGPQRLKRPMADDDTRHQVKSIQPIASSHKLDLAVFDGSGLVSPASGKRLYPFGESKWFSVDNLKNNLGTGVFTYGLLGGKARCHQYPDGLVYMEAPMYGALGPLVSISENEAVADIAEKEIVTLNDEDFPQLRGEAPTGGVRDASGISGSGMWMILDKKAALLGIVLGRKESPAGTHLVRATPIWAALNWLEHVLQPKRKGRLQPAPSPRKKKASTLSSASGKTSTRTSTPQKTSGNVSTTPQRKTSAEKQSLGAVRSKKG